MWPTQPTIQLALKSPWQADCSPTSVVAVNNESIFICTALYTFILAHGPYIFLYRESVLCVRVGVTYPAMSDWGSSIFRARIFRLFRGVSCVTMSNVTLRGVKLQIVCVAGVHLWFKKKKPKELQKLRDQYFKAQWSLYVPAV